MDDAAGGKSGREIADDIIAEFSFLDDWEDKYRHIIDCGMKLPAPDAALMVEENRLRGCQSLVHFAAEHKPPLLHFRATSDAAIVRGLIALVLRVYSGQTPEEILATPPDFFAAIGLDEHLSVTRRNGLASLMAAVMAAAQSASVK